MKTVQEVVAQTPVFLNDWSNKESVVKDFSDLAWSDDQEKIDETVQNFAAENILFASYGTGNYSGDAFVLFEKDGILYEVNGNHCSCYGLEGQWSPEETSIEAIAFRLTEGTFGTDSWCGNEFAAELKEFLGVETNE